MTQNTPMMHDSSSENKSALEYPLIVKWSEEDQAFIGSCPGIIGPCCHGQDRGHVLRQLVQIVNDWLADEEATESRVAPSWAIEQETTA